MSIKDLLRKKKIRRAIDEYKEVNPEKGEKLLNEYNDMQQRFFGGEVESSVWDRFKKYIIEQLLK